MNMQAMLQQAQQLQKKMMTEKAAIDEKTYVGKSSFVEVHVKGTKEIEQIIINSDKLEKEDIEMLQDILLVAVNDAMKQIDNETEQKLGKYTKGIPGLF